MRTEDLIVAMAADRTPPSRVGRLVLRWFLPTLGVVALLTLLILGFRPDLAEALTTPVTAMKPILPLIVAAAGGFAVLRRSDPGQDSGWLLLPVGAVAMVAVVWLTAVMAGIPAERWWAVARGRTLLFCLMAIPVIAVLPLIALIAVLRLGASTAPVRSGALAGMTAGGAGAAIYAMHCVEDSPMFFLSWYTVGILIVTVMGAFAGQRWLRW